MSNVTRCLHKNRFNFLKSCPKSRHGSFYFKNDALKKATKVIKYFGQLPMQENLFPRTLKNRPIWSHCTCPPLLLQDPSAYHMYRPISIWVSSLFDDLNST